jgi:hypothetical protein
VAFWEKQSLEKSSRDAEGCFQLKGFTARWASGAVTDVPVVRVCGEADGDYNFVMSRDMNYPDLEKICNLLSKCKLSERRMLKLKPLR